ncbi:MAG: DUF3987 domain-containing protein [Proteobacteria bacterium]|nr:DUF3987 domain-containing protein [Pseudomonadota bacterium]MBU1542381.1 DUF3987 domain-containing protein [Pseudomonadota bacterium]MBU2430819.1 DUF3987 domain-containing protein [Pseudomonadota bacterium]
MKNSLIDNIKDSLKNDDPVEITIDFSQNWREKKYCTVNDQMIENDIKSHIKDQIAEVEKPKIIKPPQTTNDQIPIALPDQQPQISLFANQSDTYQKIKAATNQQKIINNYISASEITQRNNLKYNDSLQIQEIRRDLYLKPPIPIDDYTSLQVDFPLNELPIEYQNFLNSLSQSLNVPVIAIVSGLFASIYIAARGRFKIEVKNSHFEAFTEYFVVVMPSGSKKSAIVQSFKAIFDVYIEKIKTEFNKRLPNEKLILQLYKRVERKLMKDLLKGKTLETVHEINLSLESVEKALAPLKEKLNKISSMPNLFNDIPTMKKLAENMKQQSETLSIFDAEPGIWKNRVRANEDVILLKSYTMEPFGNETATNGSVTMSAPCLTICSYIQPGVAFDLYSKDALRDDGLLPRILSVFCLSKLNIQNSIHPDINPELMAMYKEKITSILDYSWTASTNRQIETLKLNDAARQIYSNFSHEVSIKIHDDKFKNCEAFASKLAGHAVRLAGAIHFLQHDKPWEKSIESSAMRAGVAVAEFYAEHAIFAFDKKQNDSIVYARKILKWVKRHHIVKFEQRDAQRGVGHCKINQIEAGIDLLQKHKYLVQHINFKGEMVYIVNPNIFKEEY